ncbi:GFO-IDH-MocA domain-containing protein [Fusarium sp. LHS14.1]|nr:GFO-IDH-MocA domain-containing protein [Fusarium sp. LHS14.1]
MAPIRVGLIGLPASHGDLGIGTWGVHAHLRPLLSSPDYEIAAICNSSVDSAQKSIEFHGLPDSVKAYGDPEDLANDPNVDLISVSVNVAKHWLLAKPALLQGKDVFVEWPLGASLQETQELVQLASDHGSRTIVGLQFRVDPLLVKVRELLQNGTIGKVTSSVVWGTSNAVVDKGFPLDGAYLLDMKSGGNDFYIHFGHFLDGFTSVVGDFDTIQAKLQSQVTTVPLLNLATGEVVEPAHPKTSPDHILVQGGLKSGAAASIVFRRVSSAIDDEGIRWLITGSEGEIEVIVPGIGTHAQMANPGRTLRLRSGGGKAQNVSFDQPEPEYISSVPHIGSNTARLYRGFAENAGGYADFESALKTYELLERIVQEARYI